MADKPLPREMPAFAHIHAMSGTEVFTQNERDEYLTIRVTGAQANRPEAFAWLDVDDVEALIRGLVRHANLMGSTMEVGE